MANKYQGEVSIRLDRVRKLKFGFNAYADFEEAMGCSLVSLVSGKTEAEVGQLMTTPRILRALLYAALKDEEPSMTVAKAGRLVELTDGDTPQAKVEYVVGKVLEAFLIGSGSDAKKNTVTEANGTGTRSSE